MLFVQVLLLPLEASFLLKVKEATGLAFSVGLLTFLDLALQFHETIVVILIVVLSEERLVNELIKFSFEVVSGALGHRDLLG